jgi:hypothetical protein
MINAFCWKLAIGEGHQAERDQADIITGSVALTSEPASCFLISTTRKWDILTTDISVNNS